MKREYPNVPLIGVGAIIAEHSQVVLVRRGHPPLVGEWSIPGGLLEVGELLRDAVIRESEEETGLTVEPGEILGVYDRVVRENGRVVYHYVLIDFLCRRLSGDLCPGSDADEARWFTPSEIDNLKLPSDTAEVIAKGFEKCH